MLRLGATPEYFKSSRSTGYNNCVEVKSPTINAVHIADSKFRAMPALVVSPAAYAELISLVRS